jgi:hypothetical protein
MIKLERDQYGNDGSLVRAAKAHRCEAHGGVKVIQPGEFYYRAVAFPGSDIVDSNDPPWVLRICRDCLHEPMLSRFDEAVAKLLPSVTRDNGTVYTPRTVRAIMLGDEDEVNDIVVLGTHDAHQAVAKAREVLSAHWAEFIRDRDMYPTPVEPLQTWISRSLMRWDDIDGPWYSYGVDRDFGAAAVRFNLIWGAAPTNRTDTPLEGLDF